MDKYIGFDIDCKKTATSLRPENMKRPAPWPAVARSYAGAGRPFHIGVMVERERAIPFRVINSRE